MTTNNLKKLLIDTQAMDRFLARIPDLAKVSANHSRLIAYFGYFLTEEMGATGVTPEGIRECYDVARIQAPSNISDTIRKSRAFVRTTVGTVPRRDTIASLRLSLAGAVAPLDDREPQTSSGASVRSNNIVVIHGRDTAIRDDMFGFLRSVGLNPIEWNEAVRRTGHASPYTGDVVDAMFTNSQAVIAMFTPDEYVELRPDLQSKDQADNAGWQARPNVFVEAGMALAKNDAHTILVEIGSVRTASDLLGRNVIRFDGSSATRHSLNERLRTAGCNVSTTGTDWLRVGKFKISSTSTRRKQRGANES